MIVQTRIIESGQFEKIENVKEISRIDAKKSGHEGWILFEEGGKMSILREDLVKLINVKEDER